MMWLIWNMWILLLLAFMGGVVTGWILHGKSDEAPKSAPKALLEPGKKGRHAHAAPKKTGATGDTAAAPKKRAADLLQEAAPELVAPQSSQEGGATPETGAATVDAAPEPEPKTETAPVSDDLTKIKGLGPKAAASLAELGITSLAQIANWTDEDVARIDAAINGRGRIEREGWVSQAKALSA